MESLIIAEKIENTVVADMNTDLMKVALKLLLGFFYISQLLFPQYISAYILTSSSMLVVEDSGYATLAQQLAAGSFQ